MSFPPRGSAPRALYMGKARVVSTRAFGVGRER